LRALEEGEIERVGGSETIKIDVRVIASTKKNLKEMVDQGKFREDLFYRLNVFPINLPPLRERPDDIALLAKHFVGIFTGPELKLIRKYLRYLNNISFPGT
jgi:transcriptional regulator with GAF, ATPase, and Fis domain